MEHQWAQQAKMGGNPAESDIIKGMFTDTNPVLLAVTFIVSLLHSVFDMLAFKNDSEKRVAGSGAERGEGGAAAASFAAGAGGRASEGLAAPPQRWVDARSLTPPPLPTPTPQSHSSRRRSRWSACPSAR
jgi:hypothetical protein